MSATKSQMAALHELVAKELKDRIASGEATASDFANAIKFLKDNGIEAIGDLNSNVSSLAEQMSAMPEFDDDDEYDNVH
ncbi:hypothetical protein [Maritalea mediterranea]|uniref:Terminase small subunit n=1 Tax=Maritalea mediterranea TaxID=2909667 RepID=A0ABS9E6V2_9HYPH|nr:hypothetical protein [Maritalea mediterranea]MCF4098603.1 hypothetical protein [Maritalea mediterranea]